MSVFCLFSEPKPTFLWPMFLSNWLAHPSLLNLLANSWKSSEETSKNSEDGTLRLTFFFLSIDFWTQIRCFGLWMTLAHHHWSSSQPQQIDCKLNLVELVNQILDTKLAISINYSIWDFRWFSSGFPWFVPNNDPQNPRSALELSPRLEGGTLLLRPLEPGFDGKASCSPF